MILLASIIVGTGILLFALSLPLARRKVPMNVFYGVRIPSAFDSDERWFAINAYGGRQLMQWSCIIIAAGVAGFFLPLRLVSVYSWSALAIMLICVLVPVVRIVRWARRYQ